MARFGIRNLLLLHPVIEEEDQVGVEARRGVSLPLLVVLLR
jgi:hypothetical protein